MFRLKDAGDRSGAKSQLVGTPRDLTSLMQTKDPADSSCEMATILYVAKNSSTGVFDCCFC